MLRGTIWNKLIAFNDWDSIVINFVLWIDYYNQATVLAKYYQIKDIHSKINEAYMVYHKI